MPHGEGKQGGGASERQSCLERISGTTKVGSIIPKLQNIPIEVLKLGRADCQKSAKQKQLLVLEIRYLKFPVQMH